MNASTLLVIGVILVAGVLSTVILRSLPSVRLQLAGLALVAVALPLAAVLLSGMVMFHMGAGLEVTVVALAAAAVGIAGALVVARSITSRLELVSAASGRLAAGDLGERAPEGGPAEIAELASSFNAMADHLEEVFDARSQLVAWASHDLRAPVASLQAMLEAIEDGVVEPGHYLDALQGQVRLLGALIEDLFELANIDGGASLELVSVDLGALAAESARGFEPEARARGISLGCVIRTETAMGHCAPEKVERVLTNLVTNALRYTPSGGTITVSVTGAAGVTLISVEDTGIGIDPQAAERVFEPFFRADPARTRNNEGAGLGLAIARGLIEAQGGRIWTEPPPAGGTRVCFVLPADSGGDREVQASGPVVPLLAADYPGRSAFGTSPGRRSRVAEGRETPEHASERR
jgi:two-component system sensor histidine kinase BaeS